MTREQPQTGRSADFEFQSWEQKAKHKILRLCSEVIRKMLRIAHGRSCTSCGSKNENSGFDGCKSFG